MKNYKPLLANIASQILFGFTFIFMKTGMAMVGQDAVKFLSLRYAVGFITMTLLLVFGLIKVDYKTGWIGLIVICGICNPCISQVIESEAVIVAPTTQVALYESLNPIAMLLFSSLINREYPTKRQLFFVCACVVGVFISNLGGKDGGALTKLGAILIFGTIVTISIGRVFVRRASEYFGTFEITYFTTGMGALVFNAISLGRAGAAGTLGHYLEGLINPEFAASILYMGIGSCVFAFLLSIYAEANLPFAVFSSTCTIGTVVAIFAGVLLLSEPFTIQQIIGTIIIVGGVIGISFSYDTTDETLNRYHARNRSGKSDQGG